MSSRKRIAWEIVASIGLCALFLYQARLHWHAFADSGNISSIYFLAYMSITAIFFLIRRFPEQVSSSPADWIVGVCGTWIMVLYQPVEGPEYLAAWAVQTVGLVFKLWALLSLNRSFGIVAANRGVKTGGMYAFVRHPLYAAYLISHLSLVANNLSIHNGLIFGCWLGFQLFRIVKEEKLLMQDPTYRAYAATVRWRLLPFIY